MRTLFTAALLSTVSTAAFAQTSYTTVVEPVPEFDTVISAPIEYDANGVVKAQHFKAEDLSEAQLNAILAEADRVRGYQRANGVYVRPETAAPSAAYEIELYEQPVAAQSYTAAPVQTIIEPIAAASGLSHQVAKGDTLYNLSKRYNTTVAALKANNGLTSNALSLGQTLVIEAATSIAQNFIAPTTTYAASDYTVTRIVEPIAPAVQTQSAQASADTIYAVLPKDTLYAISRLSCTKVPAIIAANGITDPGSLKPGQRLTIPAGHCLK